jgi:outer membrane protein TolC
LLVSARRRAEARIAAGNEARLRGRGAASGAPAAVRAQTALASSPFVTLLLVALLLAVALLLEARAARAAGRPLPLAEAIALALEHDETVRVSREALVSAAAATTGARGAYDPLLALGSGWRESTLPVNSAFSGAPAGRLAPTRETTDATADLLQLLPTGGTVALRTTAERSATDATFDLLTPAYGTALGVELRQPLLRDRRIDPARFGVRVAAADRDRATAALQRDLAETVAAVERAYWSLLAVHGEVGVREEAVRLAQEQLGETAERIESGMAPETEIAQPRAELERRRGELLAARQTEAQAQNALKLLVLGDADAAAWGDRFAPADDAAPDAAGETVGRVDVAAAVDRALATRPELDAVAAVLERRRAETALAGDAVRPALDAVVSYDRYGLAGTRNAAAAPGIPGAAPHALAGDWSDSLDRLRDGDLDDTRLRLVFALPLGNRRARAGAAIAQSAERQAELELARARKRVRTEVLDAAAALDTARQRIEAAQAARAAAEVQLAAERERFGAGMSTNFLVLTRQNDLSRARLDEIAARSDYRQAATELLRATGTLLGERGVTLAEDPHPQIGLHSSATPHTPAPLSPRRGERGRDPGKRR